MKNILLAFLVLVNIANVIPGAPGQSKLMIRVQIADKANNYNPIALDLVLVKDRTLLKELQKLSAKEWFEKRNQYQLDYPKETGLSSHRWEWVPGQAVKLDPVTVRREIVGGIIFASYFTPGAHRAFIDPRKNILIKLGEEDFAVEILKK